LGGFYWKPVHERRSRIVTHAQIDFYRTFGFVVLPELIEPETVAALSEEFDRVLARGLRRSRAPARTWSFYVLRR
jgi:hypothetical protein